MRNVSIRDLQNHGGEVIDRVVRGERVTITKDGRAVAELRHSDHQGFLRTRWSCAGPAFRDGSRQASP